MATEIMCTLPVYPYVEKWQQKNDVVLGVMEYEGGSKIKCFFCPETLRTPMNTLYPVYPI